MVISLKASLKEKLIVEPDPAIVDRGTPIEWELLFEDKTLEQSDGKSIFEDRRHLRRNSEAYDQIRGKKT